jgi:uncharacterized protein
MSGDKYQFNFLSKDISLDVSNNTLWSGGVQLTTPDTREVSFTGFSNKKSNKPRILKIILGQKCNYSCSYCLQDPLSEQKTIGYDMTILDSIDFSDIKKIELWGGEPFIYWSYIKKVVTKLARPGLQWSMVNNGSLLSEKHIEFFQSFSDNTFRLPVSHDGPKHLLLRGEDIKARLVPLFKMIEGTNVAMSFSAVLTNQNWDIMRIHDYFMKFFKDNDLTPQGFSVTLGTAYDDNTQFVIQGDNIQKHHESMKEFLTLAFKEWKDRTGEILSNNVFVEKDNPKSVLGYIDYIQKPYKDNYTKCGMDIEEVMTIDLLGNIKLCQNTGDDYILGTVDNIDNATLEGTKHDFHVDRCSTCEVQALCQSNCPLIVDDTLFDMNCKINKAHYRAIQEVALKIMFNEIH